MNRREVLKRSSLFVGGALTAGTIAAVMNGCKADAAVDWKPSFMTKEEVSLVEEVAERIIPETETPGARKALVHRFIDRAIGTNYEQEEQNKFREGLKLFNARSQQKHGVDFVTCTPEQMDEVLQSLADESRALSGDDHIWPAMKGMVATAFFTSEVGMTQVLKYDPVPGEWIGCIDYDEVGGAWAL